MSSPFQNRTYTRLFSAQLVSLFGTGVTTIALALLAYELAGERAGEVLGIALALKMTAYVFFAPAIAVYAHRFSRRAQLIALDLIRAAVILYFPFITAVWEVYALLFLISLASAGFTPIFQASISDIVKDEGAYKKALSYSRLAYDLEQLLSPTFAAILLTVVTFDALFVLNSGAFLLSALLVHLSALRVSEAKAPAPRFWRDIRFGIAAYLGTPRLKALFFAYMTVALASAMVITNTVVYVSELLQKGESHVALAMAFCGLGSMLVALILPRWLERVQLRLTLLLGAFLLVVGLFAASFTPDWTLFVLLWFLLGVGLSLVQVPSGFLVRISCHEQDSISYFSANFSLSHLCWLVAYPLAGFCGSAFGLADTLLLFAVLGGVFAFVAYLIYPNPDPLELEHTHEAVTHVHPVWDDDHHDALAQEHTHAETTHTHRFVIDRHHPYWPS